jgi:rhodanese-related sulfurtransferase|tara:strand:+ start:51 stop:500 length:450 start_codon:yes stop_codon:yes gene_type:complete
MDFNAVIDGIKMRGRGSNLSYFGASTPLETQFILENDSSARVVDVRTRAEWAYVGGVPGSIQIEWQSFPVGEMNEAFLTQFQRAVSTDDYVMFLCRSGARSHAAASLVASIGYTKAINILDGFEGDKDSSGHRGTLSGWKFCGLPWVQG